MRKQAVRVARLSIGAALLLLGVVGAFIPILQGWIFIVAGLSVMAPESPRARRALDWAKKRIRRARHGSSSQNEVRGSAQGQPRALADEKMKKGGLA